MSYLRVIPRDLFNEANLLKCYGQLWILLDNRADHRAVLDEGDGAPFEIMQSDEDGSLSVANLPFTIGGEPFHLSRPLNSRRPWPLYAIGEGPDAEEVQVFTDDGTFTAEFTALIDDVGAEARRLARDANNLLICATNEGELYPKWCALARAGANMPDSTWTGELRTYARRLVREDRYDGSTSAETIITAAAQVRDYYLRHVAENDRT